MERTDVRSTYKQLGKPAAVAYYGYFGNRAEPIICTVSSVGRYLALTEVGHPDKIIAAFGHSRRVWWRAATGDEYRAVTPPYLYRHFPNREALIEESGS